MRRKYNSIFKVGSTTIPSSARGSGSLLGFRSAVLFAVTATAGLSAAQATRATVVTLFQENFSGGTSKMRIPVVATPVTNSSGATITGSGSTGYVGDFSVAGKGTTTVASMSGTYTGYITIPTGVTQLNVSFSSALEDNLPSDGSHAYLNYSIYFNNSSNARISGYYGGAGTTFNVESSSFQLNSFTTLIPVGAVTIYPLQWSLIYQGDVGSTATVYGSDFLITYTTVPEPAALGLMGAAGLGVLLLDKRRKMA